MLCSFMPYEGEEKYIFVSCSHEDKDTVFPIIERLDREGFRIWYDEGIEWGTEWPESIETHLMHCEVCMAFHSRSSVDSRYCRQEISYAHKTNKRILSVYLEDVVLKHGMDMQISLLQSTYLFRYKDPELFFSRLIQAPVLQPCKRDACAELVETASDKAPRPAGSKPEEEDSFEKSFDKQIDERFQEIFGTNKEPEAISSIREKMKTIKGKRFIDMIERNSETESGVNSELIGLFSLVPIEYLVHEQKGKHFTIPDVPGYKTIVLEIYINYDYKTLTRYYTCEQLKSEKTILNDGNSTGTVYYVDDPQEDGNRLVLVHINYEKGEILFNNGILFGDAVHITKKPVPFTFTRFIAPTDEKPHLSESAYDLSVMDELPRGEETQDGSDLKEHIMDAEVDETAAIIVDVETASLVKRKLYYDDVAKTWKAKIEILPGKEYLAFQLRPVATDCTNEPLSNMDIANFYKSGSYGFPKDVLEAAEYYEKDGSPEALYRLAVMFRSEESIADEDSYQEFMQMALDAGSDEAAIELAINLLLDPCEGASERIAALLNRVKEKEGIHYFLLGYLAEKKLSGSTPESAFDLYFRSAAARYKPACARLGVRNAEETSDALRQHFEVSVSTGYIADYCLGSILFFGLEIMPQKEWGLRLLKKSAGDGCRLAVKALFEIFENDPVYTDLKESLKWLQILASDDPSFANTLANRLVDGVGCEVCDENDRIALSLFQKAAEAGNITALHNLGWMHLKGRGCSVDYEQARQIFLKARKGSSFYCLGDMYEHGLGVSVDLAEAKRYYQLGAENGSEKAEKRLAEWNDAHLDTQQTPQATL